MDQLHFWALYTLAGLSCLAYLVEASCHINSDEKKGSSEVLLWSTENSIIYPEESRTISIAEGKNIILSCQGSKKFPSSVASKFIPGLKSDLPMVKLGCSTKDRFYYNDPKDKVNVESVGCTGNQAPTITKTKSICSPMGADGRTTNLESLFNVHIGWTGPQGFLKQIELCIDEDVMGTLWTRFTIHGKSIMNKDVGEERPIFTTDIPGEKRFFVKWSSSAVNKAYSKSDQAKRVAELLGDNRQAGSTKPIIDLASSSSFYLARGHISPDAAFVYLMEQSATYFFINVGPQFQSFNNGNWKSMEIAARNYADMQQRDIDVYSGLYGTLQYAHVKTGVMTNLTLLTLKGQGKGYLPVPKYYWMVIHNPKDHEAIFVIGLNNPYAKKFDETFCKQSICDSVKGITDKHSDPTKGLLQCCPMGPELLNKIPYLPKLNKGMNKWPTLITRLSNKS